MACQFDVNGECHAMACYSGEKCGARDENGNPKYSMEPIEYYENEE